MLKLKIGLVVLGFASGAALTAQTAHAVTLGDVLHEKSVDGTLSQADLQRCTLEGQVWAAASNARDQGYTRQQAFTMSGGYARAAHVPDGFVTDSINALYEDPSLADAGGRRLADTVTVSCLDPHHRYAR